MKSDKKISVVLPLLVPTPFLRAMTEFAIKTLRLHADNEFDLIVVEAASDWFDPKHWGQTEERIDCQADKYFSFVPPIGGVREVNQGIRAAETEFVVFAGNDVIVPPHWDTELLRCFDERKDCGIASLSAFEPGATVGPPQDLPLIVEGMYSPFSMFRKGWEYDESYLKIYQDSDLVMRMYEGGLRAYRSCRAHLHHLLRMTSDRVDTAEHNRQLKKDEEFFYARWGKSPLAMFAMIRYGSYRFGNEHASFLTPVGDANHPANRVVRP